MSDSGFFSPTGVTKFDGQSLVAGKNGNIEVYDVTNGAVLATGATTARTLADIAAVYEGDTSAATAIAAGASSARILANWLSDAVNILAFGAKGDTAQFQDTVTCTVGGTTATFGTISLSSGDVGKIIVITGAGSTQSGAAAANELWATITAVSGKTVTLSKAVGATLSAVTQTVLYGTDDTAALNAAIRASWGAVYLPQRPMVLVGPSGYTQGGYMISGGIALGNQYGFPVTLWSDGPNIANGAAIYHYDMTQSLFITANGGSGLKNLRITCCNRNYQNPTPAPATISLPYELYIQDCYIMAAYIAIGNPSAGGAPVYVNNIQLDFHYRGFLLQNNGDISYVDHVRAKLPTAGQFNATNGYLFEIATSAQGLLASKAFIFGGGGLITATGTTYLQVSFSDFGAEGCMLAVNLASGSTCSQSVAFTNGYLQSNNRTDATGVYANNSTTTVQFSNTSLLNSVGVDLMYFGSGHTHVTGCYFGGNSNGLHFAGGSARVQNSDFVSLASVFNFAGGAAGCYFDQSNFLSGNSSLFASNGNPGVNSANYIITVSGPGAVATLPGTISANTGYQNWWGANLDLTVQFTLNPTSTASASCDISISPDDSTYYSYDEVSVPAGSVAGQLVTLKARVPSGWFWAVNRGNSGSTIGSAFGLLVA